MRSCCAREMLWVEASSCGALAREHLGEFEVAGGLSVDVAGERHRRGEVDAGPARCPVEALREEGAVAVAKALDASLGGGDPRAPGEAVENTLPGADVVGVVAARKLRDP